MSLNSLRKDLRSKVKKDKAEFLPRFFKTGKGEYGEGDLFLGVMVPDTRKVAKKYRDLKYAELSVLLKSKFHEERLLSLLILVDRFERASKREDEKERGKIYRFYVRHFKGINNWDLIDGSAPQIVGGYLSDRSKKSLYEWARSKNLWKRRVSIMATFYDIRQKRFQDALKISKILLQDDHDLIQKAVGWMLREIGNRDRKTEDRFLNQHYQKMPRTMLRYAIEKYPERLRKDYLKGRI